MLKKGGREMLRRGARRCCGSEILRRGARRCIGVLWRQGEAGKGTQGGSYKEPIRQRSWLVSLCMNSLYGLTFKHEQCSMWLAYFSIWSQSLYLSHLRVF